jgi:L-fuconolactonase
VGTIEVIDAQVHVEEPGRDAGEGIYPADGSSFVAARESNREVTGEQMLVEMDTAGVDQAILAQISKYGWDNSYALQAAADHPDRFRVVGLIDPLAPEVREVTAEWSDEPLAVGVRMIVVTDALRDQLDNGMFVPFFEALAAVDMPLCIWGPRYMPALSRAIRRHHDVRFVLDHFGLGGAIPGVQSLDELGVDEKAAQILELADCANVFVKLTGAPSLARGASPFSDVWPLIERYVDGFGIDRLMWGTDWTRVYNGSYAESVQLFRDTDRFTDDEKRALMNTNARRIFGWS